MPKTVASLGLYMMDALRRRVSKEILAAGSAKMYDFTPVSGLKWSNHLPQKKQKQKKTLGLGPKLGLVGLLETIDIFALYDSCERLGP